jgi:aryl-alcohol dehydrogenase-like predicted oxidoreductase
VIYGEVKGIDKPVSRIIQGIVMVREDDPEGSFVLLDAAMEAGITTFDSAHVYGGGQCDRIFGRWVGERGIRDRVVLQDKCCHHSRDRRRVTPCDIETDLADCLARLGFKFIDLFVMHRDDPEVPVGAIVEKFNELIDRGVIGAYGGSNWSHERIAEANRYADEHGLVGMSVSSPHYSLAECLDDPWGGGTVSITGPAAAEARRFYAKSRMPVLPWSSLCGGFFSGRFRRDNLASFTEPADTRCVRCFCGEQNFRRLDRAAELAREKDTTVPRVALAYALCGLLNCFPLMAGWTAEQIRDNAGAADLELTAAEVAWLNLESDER